MNFRYNINNLSEQRYETILKIDNEKLVNLLNTLVLKKAYNFFLIFE